MLDRGFPLPDRDEIGDPFDESLPMKWQGSVHEASFDPPSRPANLTRPTKSRQMWKRINPGHMTQQWMTSQVACQDVKDRERVEKAFHFNAHLQKTDINMYANACAIHYPKGNPAEYE